MSSQPREPGDGGGHLGRYRLIAELGHGGMAEVYLAVMSGPAGFHKLVVIKQIRAELADDPEFLSMFLDEARLAARLNHPNVVQTNEVGEEGGRYFMAMEYLDGQPLSRVRHRLSRPQDLPLAMHLRILADVLAGLHHAHELCDFDGAPLGVVHRDVTPPNVFITYDGAVKVVDFGIAKAKNSASETKAGVVKGKVSYMAPEQARGEPPIDRRADIFAVGVLLWEAATGARPWKGMPELTILKHLFMGDIPSPRSVNPEVSPELEAIIMKAMAPKRDDRFPTAAAMQAAIEHYLATLGDEASHAELGRRVAEAFKHDRAKIKAVIDAQLAAPLLDETPGPLPVLDLPTVSEVFSVAPPTAAQTPPSSLTPPRAATPSAAPEPSLVPTSSPTQRPSSSPPDAHPSRPTLSIVAAAHAVPPRHDATHLRPAVLLGGVVLAAAALFLALWLPGRGSTPSTAEASPPATTALAPQPPAARPTVRLSVAVLPREATLSLDGEPLGQSPFDAAFPSDDATHTLRVEAPGFAPWQGSVLFDRDRVLDIVLTPAAPNPPVTAQAIAPAPVPRGRVAPAPPPRGRPQRPIDATNPYAP